MHHHITIGVSSEELEILRRDLSKWRNSNQGFTITIKGDTDDNALQEELQEVFREVLIRLISVITKKVN